MFFFRNRRATILPSTLFVAITCQSGLLFAQSPEAWPFDDSDKKTTATQPKTPVQQKLEELYRRDHRPLPDYMQNNTPANSGNHQLPRQQPTAQATPNQAVTSQGSTKPVAQQPARVIYAPQPQQSQTSTGSQETIRQQLSDYYGSQGKAMPMPQQSWNAAETPRQPVATATASQRQQPSAARVLPTLSPG